MAKYTIGSIDTLLRPFSRLNNRVDRKRVYFYGPIVTTGETTNTDGDDLPTLEWSARAEIEATQVSNLVFVNWPDDQEEEERETVTERIFSDADPEAYIDVERMVKVSLKDQRSGKKLILTFSE
jgi:hypothetical protein